MDSNDSNDSNDGFQCIAMDFNGLQWIPCSVIQIISSSPSLEVCRSPACSQRQTSTHSPTARSSAQTNICLSESRVPQNPMVDYMNCIIFIHFSHSNNYETCGTCTFWVSLILRQDMMVTHLQRALMSSTLMFLRPRVVNTWKGRIFLLTWSYATSSLSMMQLSTSWTFRTRQMVKKTHLSLKKPYFSWDRLRHTVAAKSTVSCRSWAKVSFTTFDPCWQPGNNATNSNISCNLAIICYNIALILPVSNS